MLTICPSIKTAIYSRPLNAVLPKLLFQGGLPKDAYNMPLTPGRRPNPSAACATLLASDAVYPLAEKYAVNVFIVDLL